MQPHPCSALCALHMYTWGGDDVFLPFLSPPQWSKDEKEGEAAQKKVRREEGEMRFMEPLGEVQVCVLHVLITSMWSYTL